MKPLENYRIAFKPLQKFLKLEWKANPYSLEKYTIPATCEAFTRGSQAYYPFIPHVSALDAAVETRPL